MTTPRLGQENLICAWNWERCERHQEKQWYTRAQGSDQFLMLKLGSLHGPAFKAYICDSFDRADAISFMEAQGFTLEYLNCGHDKTDSYTLDYPG